MSILFDSLDCFDAVRNKYSGVIGKIIAIYMIKDRTYLDVRTIDGAYYKTPAINWERVGDNV